MTSLTLTSSAENSCNNSCSHWLCCLCTKKKTRSPESESQTTIRVEKVYRRSHRHRRNGGSSPQFDESGDFAEIHLRDRCDTKNPTRGSDQLHRAKTNEKGSPNSRLKHVLARAEITNKEKTAKLDETGANGSQFKPSSAGIHAPPNVLCKDTDLVWV